MSRHVRTENITRANCFCKQPIEGLLNEANGNALARSLSLVDIICFGIGSTVGAGIFVVTGVAARDEAGPALFLAFLLSALACLLSALCYAEMASRVPVAGSAYTFTYTAMGELPGWFVGWNLTLEYTIAVSAVARGWAGYLVEFIDSAGGGETDNLGLLAVLIIALCTAAAARGVRQGARLNLAITIINVGIILFVCFAGASQVDTVNYTPFAPYGAEGVFRAAGTVFFSFVGFDAVSTMAGETANPSKTVPRGILYTLAAVTALYVGVSVVLTGMVPFSALDTNAPLAEAFGARGLRWAALIVGFGSVTTLTCTVLCSILGQPRIFFAMARDGLFFPLFRRLHPEHRTPVAGTLVTGAVAAVLALVLDLEALSDMVSIGTLLAFTVVCGSVLVLRLTRPRSRPHIPRVSAIVSALVLLGLAAGLCAVEGADAGTGVFSVLFFAASGALAWFPRKEKPSGFAVPWVPLVPCAGIFVNTWLIAHLSMAAIMRVVYWTALGMVVYFGYGIHHSQLRSGGGAARETQAFALEVQGELELLDSGDENQADSGTRDDAR